MQELGTGGQEPDADVYVALTALAVVPSDERYELTGYDRTGTVVITLTEDATR